MRKDASYKAEMKRRKAERARRTPGFTAIRDDEAVKRPRPRVAATSLAAERRSERWKHPKVTIEA